MGPDQIDISQIRTTQIGIAQIGVVETGVVEIHMAQILPCEIGIAQILIHAIFAGQIPAIVGQAPREFGPKRRKKRAF